MPFEKGREKTGGRNKGTPNKTTRTVLNMLRSIYAQELERLPEILEQLDATQRVNVIIKLSQLLVPKIHVVEPDFDQPKWDFEF